MDFWGLLNMNYDELKADLQKRKNKKLSFRIEVAKVFMKISIQYLVNRMIVHLYDCVEFELLKNAENVLEMRIITFTTFCELQKIKIINPLYENSVKLENYFQSLMNLQ